MGMFDTIKVDVNKLPGLSSKERDLLKDTWWQTKDFDCMLDTIQINDNGELTLSSCYSDGSKIKAIISYHGSFDFYTMTDDETWYQFQAHYKNGKLVKIDRIKNTEWSRN